MRRRPTYLALIFLVAGLVTGCTAQVPASSTPPASTPSASTPSVGDTPATAPTTSTDPVTGTDTITGTPAEPGIGAGGEPAALPDTGMAVVENVDVRILESFPVQVQAVVTGYLPDSCTTITAVEAVREERAFRIRITTERPADALCAMVVTDFEEVVTLDTAGLPAGSYEVVVNDLSVSFELPEGSTGTQPQPEAGAYPVVETETGYVMAHMDVPILDAPLESATEIGMVAAGQVASVTGASPDGAWWRVICPDDSVGDCWVSAAPEITMPTTPPN